MRDVFLDLKNTIIGNIQFYSWAIEVKEVQYSTHVFRLYFIQGIS